MDYVVMDSPVGPLTIGADSEFLHSITFGRETLQGRIASGNPVLAEVVRQLQFYFSGRLRRFDLPLKPDGTQFQLEVWHELEKIPYGETISYGALACRIGKPNAARAVGAANHSNPIPIVIPCHRVIGSDGKMVGYGGGLPIKEALLKLERLALAQAAV